MLHTLENDFLKVVISDKGAELVSVYDKKNNFDRIWCGEPSVWNRHAPILFPFIGRIKNNTYTYNGSSYSMTTQHGFARDSEFECVEENDHLVTHRLSYSPETLAIYPFKFSLLITHSISESSPRTLDISITVENKDSEKMLYSIGAHPGFTTPAPGLKRSDYYISLPDTSSKSYILLDKATGLAITDRHYSLDAINADNAYVRITDDMFDNDALIFENSQFDDIGIAGPDYEPFITLHCKDFPYMGIWSKPSGQFVCLEPWHGRTDDYDSDGNLEHKTGILTLDGYCKSTYRYSIEFH